jgi:hypothetical protein
MYQKALMSVDWTQVMVESTTIHRMLNGYYVLTDSYDHYKAAVNKVVEIARTKQIPHPFLKIHPDTPKGVFKEIKDAKRMVSSRKGKEKPATEAMHA